MTIKFGIDGTGPFFDSTYAENFANSHVKKICTGNNEYSRGPIGPGGGLPEAINMGYRAIMAKREIPMHRNSDILLTGYSRGGLGVLVIARMLKEQNIPVKAILLFDSVDRHAGYSADVVPDNVQNVFHARRDPSARSRMSFGNCGTQYTHSTNYEQSFFVCTHGAMGGTPWKPGDGESPNDYIREGTLEDVYNWDWNSRTNITFATDRRMSEVVWGFVQPFIRRHGFM
jgi:hypothetical protein